MHSTAILYSAYCLTKFVISTLALIAHIDIINLTFSAKARISESDIGYFKLIPRIEAESGHTPLFEAKSMIRAEEWVNNINKCIQ